jgi:hypothetical protein
MGRPQGGGAVLRHDRLPGGQQLCARNEPHPQQILVRLTGATTTPQAAVVTSEGKLLYLGRVDNRVEDFGKQRPSATVFDLRDALDATLSGKPVAHPSTKSIGCAITRVTESR